ncbi:hypothetical protein [Planctobacterium marinum]|uniref:hypothetical protein n=1 Tax=Planctobacterium marinum TaxID=1631968 RepID=UPI001E3DFE9D|nr:hypothetical protein [Planctobacterium marinum]MCC2603796.1 hypothetical protein [Planctobacterium marinum]
MTERPYLVSGRNTIIHKVRKLDLIITNGEEQTPIIVTHKGVKKYTGRVPENKREAKMMDAELVDLTLGELFGDEKTLLFVQTINGKEYKVDYSKSDTPLFVKIHQDSVI